MSKTANFRVRLIGAENLGRVEVFYDDQWGTICDDNWDNAEASVVCKMLGYRWAFIIVNLIIKIEF